jgi:cell division septum initiation protein DivIVA
MDEPAAIPIALVRGYSRAAVDGFLAALDEERARVLQRIAESTERLERARGATGMQRAMLAMLLDTQDVAERRRAAEEEAARILADADAEAEAILAGALAPADTTVLDLVSAERTPDPAPERALAVAPLAATTAAADDAYFAFLRGALTDEAPLGVRPETAGVRPETAGVRPDREVERP